MAPAQLSDLTGRLASIWIADLNHADGRSDRGLALIDASVIETVPAPETFGLHGSPSPPERDRYYSAVAGSLTAGGTPTLDAAVRRYVEALIDDVVDLAPAMRARISLDDTREEVTDDLQEHAREPLYLHTSPLPVELVDEAELPRWAADFARHHPRVGTHTLLVWMPPDQLAKQFTGLPEPGQGQDEGAAAGYARRRSGPSGQSGRTAQLHREMDPGPFVRAMGGRHGSAHRRFDADGVTLRHPLVVMVDGSVLPRILDRYSAASG
jgi:hypothetical protein